MALVPLHPNAVPETQQGALSIFCQTLARRPSLCKRACELTKNRLQLAELGRPDVKSVLPFQSTGLSAVGSHKHLPGPVA